MIEEKGEENILCKGLSKKKFSAGDTPQQLRILALLAEDASLFPSTQRAAHNWVQLQFWGN